MTIFERPDQPPFPSLVAALESLQKRLELCRFTRQQLMRIEMPMHPINVLDWLASIKTSARCYYSNRENTTTVAGLGVAAELVAVKPSDISAVFTQAAQWVAGSGACWVGGCAFNGRPGAHQWQGFPGARFVLPLIEVREQHGLFRLAFNLRAATFGEWQQQLMAIHSIVRALRGVTESSSPVGLVEARSDSVDRELWREQVKESLGRIRKNELKKVVLAREVMLKLSAPANPFIALQALERNNPNTYTFAIESAGKIFFGCSPERLFRREDNNVLTEALAGTVKRGRSIVEDKALENTLLHDSKLIHEHHLVSQAINESLHAVIEGGVTLGDVEVVKLGCVQHRYQKLTASVHAASDNGVLYEKLHPTPAICGYPREAAKHVINEIEQLSRGWYSGNVGIIEEKSCELSVAIRSALWDKKRLWLYSGVGIVDGSNALDEWNELESKIESMLMALGYTVAPASMMQSDTVALHYNA
ncbi:isochorismate synthase [Teredinibacter purpureus]|uniref:isochorismate synthase n=1 Tax=Teredinibacter purpureus TaxID=2731756 RepID=UPI0009E3E55A|nr:isochorismate synthase [Teredinibacter purpureus]